MAVGTLDSYLVARMTSGAAHLSDTSNASRTLLYDVQQGRWSDELCDLLGVPLSALPEVVPNWGEVARTDPATFLGIDAPSRECPATSSPHCSVKTVLASATPRAPTEPARSS